VGLRYIYLNLWNKKHLTLNPDSREEDILIFTNRICSGWEVPLFHVFLSECPHLRASHLLPPSDVLLVRICASCCLWLFTSTVISRIACRQRNEYFQVFAANPWCVLCPHRRMHAYEVPAAPVQAWVVLELRLWVEPHLHGRPLVWRVAGATGYQPLAEPPWWEHVVPHLHLSLFFQIHILTHAHTHTHTRTRATSSFQNHKSQITEAPRSILLHPRRRADSSDTSKRVFQASKWCQQQSTAQRAALYLVKITVLARIQVRQDQPMERGFPGLISCILLS
jgi:hypothetical protein